MKFMQVGSNRGSDDFFHYLESNKIEVEFGILVECFSPHIESLRKCYKNIPNILIDNVAIKPVNVSEMTMDFYYSTNDHPNFECASVNKKHVMKHYPEDTIEVCSVPVLTLEELFDIHKIKELDWLLLDIEGIDAEILLTFNWEKYNIKKIEFEWLHLQDYQYAVKMMMKGMGYVQVDSLHQYDWAFEKL